MSDTRICEHCGSMMDRPARMPRSLWIKRKWCDRICMSAARAPKTQTCKRCGGIFHPTFNRKRGHQFCSIECANTGRTIKGPYRKMRVGSKVRTVHRVTKEKEIGRPLLPTEIVHHQDHNKQNNFPSNLIITSNSQHSREHMKGNQHARRTQP